jgi:hypothetical protein
MQSEDQVKRGERIEAGRWPAAFVTDPSVHMIALICVSLLHGGVHPGGTDYAFGMAGRVAAIDSTWFLRVWTTGYLQRVPAASTRSVLSDIRQNRFGHRWLDVAMVEQVDNNA